MKTLFTMILAIFLFLNNGENQDQDKQEKIKYIGIFIGMNDDYLFEFKNDSKESTFFNEISENVEINLYDDENINKKFEIIYENYKIEILDEDDEPTGEYESGKRVLSLKEIK